MQTWTQPEMATLPGACAPVTIRDTRGREVTASESASLYVCGITPYDATHLGHAFTYVSFDLLVRAWMDQGLDVRYAQNITDIDDPLFERAAETNVDWRELADSQIELFRSDMEALHVIPPTSWVAVSEVLDPLENLVRDFEQRGLAYRVGEGERSDVYAVTRDEDFHQPHLDGWNLEAELRETGEDPERPGKKNPFDPMLWKGVAGDDYRVEGAMPGAWRPGWHVECAYIASAELGHEITMQGGGVDLIFPHHEMTLLNLSDMATTVSGQMNTGVVAYKGEKMSKSLGNLVRVSRLIDRGYEAMVIRLFLISHQWNENWEFTADDVVEAERRLTRWRRAKHQGGQGAAELLERVRTHLANNLNSPAVIAEIDEWVAGEGANHDPDGADLFADMCATLLGVTL